MDALDVEGNSEVPSTVVDCDLWEAVVSVSTELLTVFTALVWSEADSIAAVVEAEVEVLEMVDVEVVEGEVVSISTEAFALFTAIVVGAEEDSKRFGTVGVSVNRIASSTAVTGAAASVVPGTSSALSNALISFWMLSN